MPAIIAGKKASVPISPSGSAVLRGMRLPVPTSGVNVFVNAGTTNVRGVALGYFTLPSLAPAGLVFVPTESRRCFDTFNVPGGPDPMTNGEDHLKGRYGEHYINQRAEVGIWYIGLGLASTPRLELAEGSCGVPRSVADPERGDHGAGAAPTAFAVDVDRARAAQARVDQVEDRG